jgi:ketohexokinase
MSDDLDARRILGVGVATLDIINLVATYPPEDDEIRALGQERRRGGNVTNTLVVLSQLGHACSWAGTLGGDLHSAEILDDLEHHRVDASPCIRIREGLTPTSYVVLSQATGSRTIVHYRRLPELTAAQFAGIDLAPYDWVHFEGRAPAETAAMCHAVRGRSPRCTVSLELEKPRPHGADLLVGPQVIFFSRVYAMAAGWTQPEPFLEAQWAKTSARLLVLPWGAAGAYAQARDGQVLFAPACRPPQVRDTLGAGDVFNAAAIDGLLRGLGLDEVLIRANRLAGHKCGLDGLNGVVASARAAGLLRP